MNHVTSIDIYIYINALDVFTMCAQIADDAVHMSHAARLQDSTSTCPVRFVRFFSEHSMDTLHSANAYQ